jgi:hypothetical protein
MREIHALFVLIIAAVIVGLVLRYGATSVPLAQTAVSGTEGVLNDLTLKGGASVYPYYAPESPHGTS